MTNLTATPTITLELGHRYEYATSAKSAAVQGVRADEAAPNEFYLGKLKAGIIAYNTENGSAETTPTGGFSRSYTPCLLVNGVVFNPDESLDLEFNARVYEALEQGYGLRLARRDRATLEREWHYYVWSD